MGLITSEDTRDSLYDDRWEDSGDPYKEDRDPFAPLRRKDVRPRSNFWLDRADAETARRQGDLYDQMAADRDPAGWMLPGDWDDKSTLPGVWLAPESLENSEPRGYKENDLPQWELFDPEDVDFTRKVAERLTQFVDEGLISNREHGQYLSDAYRTNRIPSREGLQQRKIRKLLAEDKINRHFADVMEAKIGDPDYKYPVNDLRLRLLKYCYLLEEMRDFMDRWVKSGMDTSTNEVLEQYLVTVGRNDARPGRPELGKTEYERGKVIVGSAWMIFRPYVNHAIASILEPHKVRFDKPLGDVGRHDIIVPRYKIDPDYFREEEPILVVDVLVHEPMHDRDKFALFHAAYGSWGAVDDEIGWRVYGNWSDGVTKAMGYVQNIMVRTHINGEDGAWNAWDLSLIRADLKWTRAIEESQPSLPGKEPQ